MKPNSEITLEICSNTEWLRDNAGMDLTAIEEGCESEAADELGMELHDRLTDAGYDKTPAKGQRTLYHGWHGENTFKHKLGPVGTFDELTAEQVAEIYSAIEGAIEAAIRAYPRT